MKLPALLVSDLHLTANPRDEYRWSLFPWLQKQIGAESIRTIVILGDLTDAKDYHPSELTNRVVQVIADLAAMGVEVVILMGNHDYLRTGHSYFAFLSRIPGVRFITTISELPPDDGPSVLCLPHSKAPAKDWAGLDLTHYNYVFMHQTISGARASNGVEMEGEGIPDLQGAKVYSGDIHVPQIIGGLEYVGSPYHVHFGDSFKPRALLLDRRNRPVDLEFPSLQRLNIQIASVRDLRRFDLLAGDQVKLTIALAEAEKHEWAAIKREALAFLRRQKVEVCGVKLKVMKGRVRLLDHAQPAAVSRGFMTDEDIVCRYLDREDLGAEALTAALEVIE